MYPVLQIALDLGELVKSIEIASSIIQVVKCKHIWLEAGTPLLKAWGRLGVKTLKDVTRCFLVADTKTIDVPRIEAEIVFDAGADAFTVLGVADDETLREAFEVKRETGKMLIVDLIGHRDPYSRALEVTRYEPDLVYFHIGISVQRSRGLTGEQLLEEAIRVKEKTGVRIGIAGGLKPGVVGRLVDRGVDVVVVGSAITQSKDPAETTLTLIREMGYRVE